MSAIIDMDYVVNNICEKENLVLEGKLGQGAFKKVYKVKSNDKYYALKIIPNCSPRTKRETDFLKKFCHPNIAYLFKSDKYTKNNKVYDYVIEEYLEGGTLTDFIEAKGNLNNELTLCLGTILLEIISYIWEFRLVHRDIKPDNIILRKKNSFEPVLTDFGIARNLLDTSYTQSWLNRGPGTPYFASPEQLNNEKRSIDWRSDQFSVGVLISLTRFNKHPYQFNEPLYSNKTVNRVAIRGTRNNNTLIEFKKNDFDCLERMTRIFPRKRYQNIQELINLWKNQGG